MKRQEPGPCPSCGHPEDEVRLACVDRGIAVLGRRVEELREVLGRWLLLTDATRLGEAGSEEERVRLLLMDEKEWAAARK